MDDDIKHDPSPTVTRLRNMAWMAEEGTDTSHLTEAVNEIERLRAVGDKLAMHLDAFFGMLEPASNEIAEVLKEWEEARRG